ncbi:MAG: hypothetical protein ACQEWV_16540 [Bacillota bacterium]
MLALLFFLKAFLVTYFNLLTKSNIQKVYKLFCGINIGLSAILLAAVSVFVELGTVFQLSSICFIIVILMTLLDFRKQRQDKKKQSTVAV